MPFCLHNLARVLIAKTVHAGALQRSYSACCSLHVVWAYNKSVCYKNLRCLTFRVACAATHQDFLKSLMLRLYRALRGYTLSTRTDVNIQLSAGLDTTLSSELTLFLMLSWHEHAKSLASFDFLKNKHGTLWLLTSAGQACHCPLPFLRAVLDFQACIRALSLSRSLTTHVTSASFRCIYHPHAQ